MEEPYKPRKGHPVLIGFLIVLCVLIVGVGAAGYKLYTSAQEMQAEAREIFAEADTLKDALKNGDSEALSNSVNTIVAKTDSINAEVNAPLWNIAAKLPVVGTDIQTAQTLASVAEDLVNNALVPVANAASGMKLSDLMQDGAINVGMIQSLSGTLEAAIPVVQEASATIQALPEPTIPQVKRIVDKIQGPLASADELLNEAGPMLKLLPQMLGADGQTRTYLLIAQNNAEFRGTGGLAGSWGVMTVTDGRIEMGDFASMLNAKIHAEITQEEAFFNMNDQANQINGTPDFTRVGYLAQQCWAGEGRGVVDGVVAIDPVFLQTLLKITGSEITAFDGTVINGDNAAQVLLNGAYWMYGNDNDASDAFFTSVAGQAFHAIMDNLGGVGFKKLWNAIDDSAKRGNFIVWMANPDEQALMDQLGFAGSLCLDPTTPQLGVYLNDDTWAKICWYADVRTTYDAGTKNENGTTTYNVTTTITNTMTEEEAWTAPKYIYGYNPLKRDRGDMLTTVFLVAPAGGYFDNIHQDEGTGDTERPVLESSLSGLQVFRLYAHIEPGQTVTFTYQVITSPEAVEPMTLRTTPLGQTFA